MTQFALSSLDRVFHERGRLAICSALIAHPEGGHLIDTQYARYHENGNEAD